MERDACAEATRRAGEGAVGPKELGLEARRESCEREGGPLGISLRWAVVGRREGGCRSWLAEKTRTDAH